MPENVNEIDVEAQRRGHALARRHRIHAAAAIAMRTVLVARLVVKPIHRLLAIGPQNRSNLT